MALGLNFARMPGIGLFRSKTLGQILRSRAIPLAEQGQTFTRATSAYNPATNAITGAGVARKKIQPIYGQDDSAYLIEGPRTNLLSAGTSERFALWTQNLGVITTDAIATAPDATLTASTIQDASAANACYVSQTFTVAVDSLSHCFSMYVLKTSGGTAPTLAVNFSISGGTTVNSNLRLNTDLGTQPYFPNANATITSAGAYWRVTIKLTNNSSALNTSLAVNIYPAAGVYNGVADSAAVTGTATVYGAFLEKAEFPSSYISNRNLLLNSNAFGAATWTGSANIAIPPVVTADQALDPDGVMIADQIVFPSVSGAGARSILVQSFTATAQAYTFQVRLRATVPGNTYIMATPDGVTYIRTLCAVTTAWQVFTVSGTLTAATWFFQIGVDLRDASQVTQSAITVFACRCQGEYGSTATTCWANSTAVGLREADSLTVTYSPNVTSGTLTAVAQSYGWTGNAGGAIAQIVDDTANTLRTALWFSAAGVSSGERIDTGGSPAPTGPAGTPTNGANSVVSMTWSPTQAIVYLNGVAGTPAATVTQPWLASTTFTIGAKSGGTLPAYSWVTILAHGYTLTADEERALAAGIPNV